MMIYGSKISIYFNIIITNWKIIKKLMLGNVMIH